MPGFSTTIELRRVPTLGSEPAIWSTGTVHDDAVRDETIRDEGIRLGQFLKLAGLIEVGGDAKAVLGAGMVEVNDVVEQRRGRQLVLGDVVSLRGEAVRVARA